MASSSKELITLEAYAFYSWRTVGENRAILENLVPVLAKAGGEHAGMGKVVGFRSGCGEWIVETSQKPHVYH